MNRKGPPNCPICGHKYTPVSGKQIYCSKRCANKASRCKLALERDFAHVMDIVWAIKDQLNASPDPKYRQALAKHLTDIKGRVDYCVEWFVEPDARIAQREAFNAQI